MIKVFVHGRLTRDPELRHTQGGTPVCSFTVASDKRKREDGADFIDCQAWNGLGEMISKYFTKGKEIVLAGALSSRKYQDRNGNNRTAWEVTAENVEFCGGKADAASHTNTAQHAAAPAQSYVPASDSDFVPVEVDPEDVPF